MRAAYFRVMALDLWRDKGALAMAFLLPGVVFVIFALIFSAAAGGDLSVRLALLDQRQTVESGKLAAALTARPEIAAVTTVDAGADSAEELLNLVRSGQVDAAVRLRDNQTAFSALGPADEAPVEIVFDPLRSIAATIVAGAVQAAWMEALPGARIRMVAAVIDQALVPFTDGQRTALELGLQRWDSAPPSPLPPAALFQLRSTSEPGAAPASVSYYAGAVAMLFLLLASLNGALTVLDEKQCGLFDRLSMGPGGVGAMIEGKFSFLVLQGFVQVAVIYTVAWAVFGVDLPGHWAPWAAVTLAAASCSAGLALLFVSACGTRQQAQTLGHIAVLLLSAIGGSMVPRFLMPNELQGAGWFTPNTWALEAYEGIFRRGENLLDLGKPLALMAGTAALGLLGARVLIRRTGR